MAFKINVSDKGKTFKVETESENLIRIKIGEVIRGESISPDLEGYELEITGTSDSSGFPGIKGEVGDLLRRILLTRKDKGMNDKRRGVRLRKSVRGEEISEKTSQINMKVVKQGKKKFEKIIAKPSEAPAEGEAPKEAPAETKTPEAAPADAPSEEAKATDAKKEEATQPDEEPKETDTKKQEEAQPDEEPKAS